MTRHYIKIPSLVAAWVPDGAEGDWRGGIVSDVARTGRLTVERMSANDEGVRAAVHGDRYCIEIGRDRDPTRSDTLFLVRVERAAKRLPSRVPVELPCELVLWPGGRPPVLDPVDDLFDSASYDTPEGKSVATVAEPGPEVSPLLKRILRAAPGELRALFRPGTDAEESDEAAEFLQSFQNMWSRLRLDRYLRLSPRQDALIRGRVKPQSLPASQRAEFKAAFGVELLHRIAVDDESRVVDIVKAIASIPIRSTDRAAIWIATLDALSSAELRRELHECTGALSLLAADDTARARGWRSVIASGLVDLAQTSDDELRTAIEDAGDPADILQAVIKWARELAFPDEWSGSESADAETEPHPPPAVAPASASSPTTRRADEWVIGLRLPDRGPFERLHSALERAASLSRRRATPASIDEVVDFHTLAEEVNGHFKEWQEAVGNVNELRQDLEDARTALRRLRQTAGPASFSIVGDGVTPRDVTEIADLLENPALTHVPDWLLSSGTEPEHKPCPRTKKAWATVLVDAERRGLVRLFCDLALELNEPESLAWIAAPAAGDDLERHLREWFQRVREFLREVPPEWRAQVAQESPDLRFAQEHAARLRQLETEVPAGLWASIDADLLSEAPETRSARLAAYERAVAFCREQFGSLDGLSLPLLKARVEKELSRADTDGIPSTAAGRVTVEHNYLEGRTARATLTFAPAESGEDYGSLALPLVVETDQPRPLNVRFRWEFSGEARAAWSRDWPGPEPGDDDPVSVPIYGWHRQPDPTKWHHPLVARLPIRTPKAANPRFAVAVTVLEAQTGKPLGNKRSLRWDSVAPEPRTIGVAWGDATEPSHVRNHPIGPQGRADALRARFAAGSSVAVIAPRRFGKSTLVEYFITEGTRHKLLIPPAIVCTRYASSSGFDYERLWNEVSEALVDKIGARLKRESPSALPTPEAFDAARTKAQEKGYRAVVLLFDEAQLFFAGQNGIELGSAVKTLLERHLARRGDDSRVPLLFGFIGLPSLRRRAGSDLMGLLNPVEETRMDESELRPLIAKMTSGLQTTRGARQRLATTAGNLLILRALLEKLAVRATRDRRVWVNVDDVMAVEEALKQDLQNGLELTVASYVRDVLNAADRVDDWHPIPSLPAAAAWARTWIPTRPESELKTRALEMLNQWCRLSQGDEQQGIRLEYTPEVLEHHLQQLRERRVLDGSEFVSALLRAWLSGTAGRRSSDAAFREALFAGAQRRIRLPDGAAPIAQGAQATIWRYEQYAYRIKKLADEQDRQRFIESTDMLEALRQIVRRRDAGSDHIFDLIDMGLSAQNEREAVQVYRWIRGHALAGREGAFAADIVIEIGAKLARGVRLLHTNNILHRDIHPRNIILDDASDPATLRPVLIDFGFARTATASMHTTIAGDHVAPEVQGSKPEWTRAADVYALGSTLLSLIATDDDGAADLRSFLEKAMSSRSQERPTAEAMVDQLEALEVDHSVNERRTNAWREMLHLVGSHWHIPWFKDQMNKMQDPLVSVALGWYRTPEQRYGVVADFLNQLTESSPGLRITIWEVGKREVGAKGRILKALGALRASHVHGIEVLGAGQRTLVTEFLELSEQRKRTHVRQGAEVVARLARLNALPELVGRLTNPAAHVAP